ncbi:hypothetical protein FP2506_01515 [Fulvimarina pelagi HTCC2506]|uniref:Uncharacterized protein n=1 Tax=Fulvimarina pelagi HTCC2506 TaxID=314231 RepID=Q0G1Z4_9HYPH|nr:hypothetical protein FP2506_01515 [Fulvimarina pelagi HTCC2506]
MGGASVDASSGSPSIPTSRKGDARGRTAIGRAEDPTKKGGTKPPVKFWLEYQA